MAYVQSADSLLGFSTPRKKDKIVARCDDDACLVDDGTPLRPIFCLKRKSTIKEFEEKEDCFILDFDPEEDSFDPSNVTVENGYHEDSPDIAFVAEKGQVACRDYPHARHLCVKHPFEKTPHESFCKMCYCYVCDISAPCKSWSGTNGHCHAIDNEGWKLVRSCVKEGRNP